MLLDKSKRFVTGVVLRTIRKELRTALFPKNRSFSQMAAENRAQEQLGQKCFLLTVLRFSDHSSQAGLLFLRGDISA